MLLLVLYLDQTAILIAEMWDVNVHRLSVRSITSPRARPCTCCAVHIGYEQKHVITIRSKLDCSTNTFRYEQMIQISTVFFNFPLLKYIFVSSDSSPWSIYRALVSCAIYNPIDEMMSR